MGHVVVPVDPVKSCRTGRSESKEDPFMVCKPEEAGTWQSVLKLAADRGGPQEGRREEIQGEGPQEVTHGVFSRSPDPSMPLKPLWHGSYSGVDTFLTHDLVIHLPVIEARNRPYLPEMHLHIGVKQLRHQRLAQFLGFVKIEAIQF